MLNGKGKIPFKMEARADRDFKKGELVLAPFGTKLVRAEAEEAIKTVQDPKVVDEALLSRATATMRAKTSKRQDGAEGLGLQATFWIGSPLLLGKTPKSRESCCENLAPFWAVQRPPRAVDNMLLESVHFEVPGLVAVPAQSYPCMKKGNKFLCELQIMRNSKKVSKGDLLHLPWREE